VTVLSAEEWTVRGQGLDGPRPSAGASSLSDGWRVRAWRPDSPCMRRGGGVRRWHLDLTPEKDPVGEETS
jgi:hypothetical protein